MKKRTLLSWSSGKDSAWALHVLRQMPNIELVGLFCTTNREFERVSMHGVRTELLKQQAKAVGLPIELIEIPYPCSDSDYEKIMAGFIEKVKEHGIESIAFGDLFLEDIRKYREERLAGSGIEPIFPLWGKETNALSKEMVDSGLKAIVTCVDPRKLSKEFAGRNYDQSFLDQIPASVDPCGENGEFHTFVFGGHMFDKEIEICAGETVTRDGFVFIDLFQY